MATRTISDAGGNWNATAAWVEGVVPVAGDDVVATATSGNLTVNVASACATMILTGYTGVLAINSTLDMTSTLTFVSTQGTMTTDNASSRYVRVTPTAGPTSLTSGGKTFPCKLLCAGATQTFTFVDGWTITGLFGLTGSGTAVLNSTTSGVSAGGLSTSQNSSGTTVFTLTSGTWISTASYFGNSLTFAGNVTVSGVVGIADGMTLTHASGAITVTGSTLSILNVGNVTLDTGGMTWNAISYGGNTLTLNSTLLATTFQLGNGGNSPLLAGAFGFTVGTLSSSTLDSSRTVTFTQTNTYTVTTAFTVAGTASFRRTLASSSGTLRVPIVFSGASQSANYVNTTRVDSSGGNTIHSSVGTFTDTLNWDNLGGVLKVPLLISQAIKRASSF